ncbi:MAG TPA: GNAT family N-acetyltransferase, partial [Solirubrobacteraceae bacterium]|nr:GNAT family N-acetyltransferase [Solirubrobacteraceae bacterium]
LPFPPLADGVVALRGFESSDVPALAAACQDPQISRFTLVPSPYGEDDARAYLQRVADGRAAGTSASFAIVGDGDPGALLGTAGLNVIDWAARAADVGYWLTAPVRGHGLATRAVELLVVWAFDSLGLERLDLRAHEENHASQAVAARTGFHPVAAPVVQRPECDHMPDVFFARRRGG